MKQIVSLVKLLRPRHWVKNVLCFAGVFFTNNFNFDSIYAALIVVVLFSAASSAVYIFNDIIDRERDREHPIKRNRPIASGHVSFASASLICLLLLAITLVGSFSYNKAVFVCLILYLSNNFFYSLWLKHKPLIDVMCIAFGFMLRLFAGVYVLNEQPTVWFSLCTFFLTLLFGFSKRRAELFALGEGENLQRVSLSRYTLPYLDSLINSASTMTVICYGLFSTSYEKNPNIILTLPIVYYAIMQYKGKIMIPALNERFGEEPEKQLFDTKNVLLIILWLAVYFITSHGFITVLR